MICLPISLIAGNLRRDRFVSDCAHHQPSLASRATARQATLSPIVAKQEKAASPKPLCEGGLYPQATAREAGLYPQATAREAALLPYTLVSDS